MNVFRSYRIPGRALSGGLLIAAIVTGAAVAAPVALASQSSTKARTAQTSSGRTISWSVIPAGTTAPDTRSKFSYTNIKPGSTITDHVAVLNRGKQSIAFTVYATDATGTTLANALILMPAAQKPRDIGSWVTFPRGVRRLSIIIPGGRGIIETFKIAVPRHATPGDHTGGMIAMVSFNKLNSKGQLVTENQRIAVPIELRVAGPLHTGLRVESISTGFHSPLSPFATGSATVSYTVQNFGNVRLTGSQTVSVTGPFGMSSKVQLKNLPTVLPGDSVRINGQPRGLYPFGPMTAHVRVMPGIPSGEPPLTLPAGYVTGSASLFAVPWSLIVLIVLLIGAAVAGWRGRGWQRRRLRARLNAVADSARRETERRLLGSKGISAADPSPAGPAPAGPQRQA
jgi:hypothetical protein